MATLIEPIEFPGVDAILQDWEKYRDIFINVGVIAFRNAFINFDDQKHLMVELGKKIGWHVSNPYSENHQTLPKKTGNHCILNWHVEHSYWDNPICAAAWNMHTFKEDPFNGRTLFYPMDVYFDNLEDKHKELALTAYIRSYHEPEIGYSLSDYADPHKEWNQGDVYIANKPIAIDHFLTGKKVYRPIQLGVSVEHLGTINCLDNVNGQEPTELQIQRYYKQALDAHEVVAKNKADETSDICLIHEWREGDLLIPDLFRMAHSITGGFESTRRQFYGIWATRYPWPGEYKLYDNTL